MSTPIVVSTPMLLAMANTADRLRLNRRIAIGRLATELDPNGIHVVGFTMLHNESEMRCEMLMKMRGSMEPRRAWLDVPLDRPKGHRLVCWDDVTSHSAEVLSTLAEGGAK